MREGTERHYDKGDYFFRQGEVPKYISFIKTGSLTYVAMSADGTEHSPPTNFPGFLIGALRGATAAPGALPRGWGSISAKKWRAFWAWTCAWTQ